MSQPFPLGTDTSCIGSVATTQHVCVYHQGETAFVSVKVKNNVDGHEVNKWTFFDSMMTKDMIYMLQPNNTELFEGRVKKVRLKEDGGDDHWYVIAKSVSISFSIFI